MEPKWSIILLVITLIAPKALGEPGQKRDAYDDARALLQIYAASVNQVVTSAERYIANVQEEMFNTGDAIKNINRRIFLSTQQGWLDDLQVLEQDVDLNEAALQCIADARQSITTMSSAYTFDIESCIDDRLRSSQSRIQQVFVRLFETRRSVDNFRMSIDLCRVKNDDNCIMGLISLIESETEFLPIKFENDIREIGEMMDTEERYLQDCTTTLTDSFLANGPIYVATARECLHNTLPIQ